MSTLRPPAPSPSPPRRPPQSERVQRWINQNKRWINQNKLLAVCLGAIGLAVAVAVMAAVSKADDTTPGKPSGGGANRATVTSCKFSDDGWLEASGTAVRGAGTDPGMTINVLVNGVYVDRDYIYDAPVGETQYWSVSEPDVARGSCSVDVT